MPLRWGVLGTASIAARKMIPGLHASTHGVVTAVASRDLARATGYAAENGIARAYGTYQLLLDDAEIDAVYIPLPNHLHLDWSLRALDAGKHVLCEKPIGLTATEARALRDAMRRHPTRKVAEAFMYRCHPRWEMVRKMVLDGAIGDVGAVHTFFSYDNRDARNIRNVAAVGGGARLDIGCYGVSVARWLFGAEPVAVHGVSEIDPAFGTDRVTSAVLDFGRGLATLTCATQLAPHQSVSILGTRGRIELDLPFNPPSDQPTTIRIYHSAVVEEIVIAPCDQFTIQANRFNAAVLEDGAVPVSIDDAVANMIVLDQLA